MKRSEPEKALGLLERSVKLRDDMRLAHIDIGVILTGQKRYQEALAALLRAQKLDPGQPEVHYRLGRLYQAMSNVDAAKEEFARVQPLHQKTRRYQHSILALVFYLGFSGADQGVKS